MNLPRISIITPSYNQGHFIEQTICSVLDQGYPDLEYIIMDGGSRDNTTEIIKKYEKHISYWISEKDSGQSDAINKGFRRASGEIINWLNSDDYYEHGALHHIAHVFSDPTVKAYCGRSRVFSATSEKNSKGTDVYPGNLFKTVGWARIDQPETFFRKKALDETGFLNKALHFVMDKDLWIRFLCKWGLESVMIDDKRLVHFRLHGESKTVSLHEKFEAETRSLYYTYASGMGLTEYQEIYRELFPVQQLSLEYPCAGLAKEDWRRVFNYQLLLEGLQAYAQNDYGLAKNVFSRLQPDWLEQQDAQEMVKVRRRMKWLPPGLKKIINRTRPS